MSTVPPPSGPAASGSASSGMAAPGMASGAPAGGEPTNWLRPSARLWRVRVLQVLVGGTVGLIVLALIGLAAGGGAGAGIGAAVAVVGALVVIVTAHRRVAAWGYAERDADLLVRRGVLFRRLSVVPYGRMQFVDVTAGPFERVCGVSTVRMHTAAAASDARIPGLPSAEAARLRDQLTKLGEAQAAGL